MVEILGSLPRLPILSQVFGARFVGVLFMIGICKELSRIVVEGICKDPVGWVVHDQVANPLDMV